MEMEILITNLRRAMNTSEIDNGNGSQVGKDNVETDALTQSPKGKSNYPDMIFGIPEESRVEPEPENSLTEHSEIPKFYSRPPNSNESIQLRIRQYARDLQLKSKMERILCQEELAELYSVMEKFASPPFPGDKEDEKFIGFANYKKMVSTLNENYQEFLTTSDGHPAFVTLLTNDPYMRLRIDTLFRYVIRKSGLRENRALLAEYDETGEGYITEYQMEEYIRKLIPTLYKVRDSDPNFHPFYVCAVATKFFFFLDPNRTKKLKIVDILASGLIDELEDLRLPTHTPTWFSLESIQRIYSHFIELDKDKNGMLSAEEFFCYSSGERSLTPVFVKRIFEESLTFDDGQMDFRTYTEIVLAFENPKEIPSLKLFFKWLDVYKKGYLDAFTLQYLYKDILNMMEMYDTERVSFGNVKDEMFDMIKPVDPLRITFQDLVRSGCGHILFTVFTDFHGFFAHEYREASTSENVSPNDSIPV